MKEAGIRFNQTYLAHDEAPKVPQPSKRPLHDPPPSIARELATILMGPALVGGTCRNDGFNALPGQTRRQRIAVIPPIHNQALRPLAGPAGFAWTADRDGAEVRFKARAPAGVAAPRYAPSGVPTPSTSTIYFVCLPRFVLPTLAPSFHRDETAIGKALIPAELLLVIELGQEGPPPFEQHPDLFPLFEPPPAGTRAAVPAR